MSVRDLFGTRRQPKTAFVLGGGGNLGALQVGMVRALLERDVRPDVVVGCSVGALNGAAIASEPSLEGVRRLESLWLEMSGAEVFPSGRLAGPWLLLRKGASLYPNTGLRQVIESWVGTGTFEDCAVPLHVVATSLRTGRETWFSSGELTEPLLASAALPAVFPPVHIHGEPFIDGGVVDNVPMSRAIQLGARRVFVLRCSGFHRPRPAPSRPLDVLVQAFSIARSYRFESEQDRTPEGVEVVTIPASEPPSGLRYNDFSRSEDLISKGYAAAVSALGPGTAALGS